MGCKVKGSVCHTVYSCLSCALIVSLPTGEVIQCNLYLFRFSVTEVTCDCNTAAVKLWTQLRGHPNDCGCE